MFAPRFYRKILEEQKALPTAICVGDGWDMLYANAPLLTAFSERGELAPREPFMHYLKNNGFNELDEFPPSGDDGSMVVNHAGGEVYALRWFSTENPDRRQPVRVVTLMKVPLESIKSIPGVAWQELNVLIDSIHDGIWVIDGDGITLRVNKAMERITGLRAQDVVGKHVSEPMKRGLFRECVTLLALAERRVVSMFDDYANGKRCLNTSTPIFDSQGKIWRVIASIRDITELESLQAKLGALEQETQAYKTRLMTMEQQSDAGLVGHSQAIRGLRDAIYKAGRTEATTLILGDTGTGKTQAAKAIHNCGSRAQRSFVSINCGAIPESLIESELFGYDAGAFTGAAKGGKQGMFELANGGTLLLDEIGELPMPMQAKLLQVLDERSFYRVGGTRRVSVDVHILAATNKDLADMVRAKTFREDLYYRLRVITMHIPPLRERSGDIPSLAIHFLEDFNTKNGTAKQFSSGTLAYFLNYDWPGNVRELQALVLALASMSDGDIITEADLPTYMCAGNALPMPMAPEHQSLAEALETLEKKMVEAALREGGSTYKAAKILNISQSSVVRKAQRYKLGIVAVTH